MKHSTSHCKLINKLLLQSWLTLLMMIYSQTASASSFTILAQEVKLTYLLWLVFWVMGMLNVLILSIRGTFKSKLLLKLYINRWININLLLAFICVFIWLLIDDVNQTMGIAYLFWFLYVSPAILLFIALVPATLYYFIYKKIHQP